jgi:hypothetical protein
MKKLILAVLFNALFYAAYSQANGMQILNKPSGGAIGSAATTVDVASLFNVAQTTSGQTLTVPSLTNTSNGKSIHINNTGSAAFTLLSKTIEPGTGIILRWTGSGWNISGLGNATAGSGNASLTQVITDGDTSHAPSGDAVYDALFTKVDKSGSKVLSDENYTTAEKTKLAGIEAGATANSSDATLFNRSNHTGSQPISTITNLQTTLDGKEPSISATSTSDYYRGDKTFQPLNKTAVGLGNVDNTSDANKPVSSATQTALNAKEPTITATTSADYYRGDKTFATLNKSAVGLGNVDNTSDANKPVSTATQAALDAKQPINAQSSISASAIDWTYTHLYKTLSANTTFTFSNVADGKTIVVAITNTASNYTVTWPTVDWGSAGAPVQRVGAVTDIYTFVRINGTIYGSARQ